MSDIQSVKYPITADNSRYVKNPLVVMSEEYIKNTSGSDFRAGLNTIANKYDGVKDTFVAKIEDGADEATSEAKEAAQQAKTNFLTDMYKETGLAIASIDNMERFTAPKKWFGGTTQRWRETVQYKLDKSWMALGWNFNKGLDKLNDLVKATLNIEETQASNDFKLTEDQKAKLKQRLEDIAKDDSGSPFQKLAYSIKTAIDGNNTNNDDAADLAIPKPLMDMMDLYPDAVEGLKALAPQIMDDSVKTDDLLKEAIGILIMGDHVAQSQDTDEGESPMTLPQSIDMTFAMARIIEGPVKTLLDTIAEQCGINDENPLSAYLREAAGFKINVIQDAPEPIVGEKPSVTAPGDNTTELLTGKRTLADLDEELFSHELGDTFISNWNEEGSIQSPTPKYLMSQEKASVTVVPQLGDKESALPETLNKALEDAATYLNGVVIEQQDGELNSKDAHELSQLVNGLNNNMLAKRGFFKHLQVEYKYDPTAGLGEQKETETK